ETVCADLLGSTALRPEALQPRIEQTAAIPSLTELDMSPGEALGKFLGTLDDQSQLTSAQEDPGPWARQALSRLKDWLGVGSEALNENHDWRKTKLNRSLASAAQKVAEEWDKHLNTALLTLMEFPGARVAAAEAALQRVEVFCLEQVQGQ